MIRCLTAFLFIVAASANASEVEIVNVSFESLGNLKWRINTTLKHDDTGWDHYADVWRILTESGIELGDRVLLHPHEDEQPFTRSLSGLKIPESEKIVFVEAHDTVHGWSTQRVRVDLTTDKGDHYSVRR